MSFTEDQIRKAHIIVDAETRSMFALMDVYNALEKLLPTKEYLAKVTENCKTASKKDLEVFAEFKLNVLLKIKVWIHVRQAIIALGESNERILLGHDLVLKTKRRTEEIILNDKVINLPEVDKQIKETRMILEVIRKGKIRRMKRGDN